MSGAGEPGREWLQAMAYADGELAGPERAEFEALLATRPDLQREVAQLRRLQALGRQMAGPEPMDFEWRRLEGELVHRAGLGLGFALLLIGAAALIVLAGWGIATDPDLSPSARLALGGLLGGFLVLLGVHARARLRSLPYDPYTEIRR